jgi:hypothetical protein
VHATRPVTYTIKDVAGDAYKNVYAEELARTQFTPRLKRNCLRYVKRMTNWAEVLGYSVDEKNTSKFGRYIVRVRLGDGSEESVALGAATSVHWKGRQDRQVQIDGTQPRPGAAADR